MRFRYREYMGGPDPLAETDPPPQEAVRSAVGLLELIAGARAEEAGRAGTTEEDPPEAALAAAEEALTRYADGDRDALVGLDTATLRGTLGPAAYGPLDRLDAADHELTPRELRRLGEVALGDIEAAGRAAPGGHLGGDGAGDDPTGAAVPHDGLERTLDAVATLREAMLRRAAAGGSGAALRAEDVRYTETEPAGAAAVCLLVDLSHSMVTRGLHEAATRTALALHTLVRTRHPEDRVMLIGFGDHAREMTPADLVEHDWARVPGTNLQHALHLARRHLRRHRGLRALVLVVTDGEPTAHLGEDGDARFAWPPAPRTVEVTAAELDAVLGEGATVTFFLLADDPRLREFRALLERRRGVGVVNADADALGPSVIDRYLRRRPGP
ncbi:VWA domain-containing protein [Nocardiopsis sp. SBT366]|uniref:VWA domain-containing protein n=1 Tax=Nocardiopsis sp. SBT366 TaxID=1580529 RepID=UPI00066A9654|nr:VWA domain-containing protein [Nocardiopsis sp. SBT366]